MEDDASVCVEVVLVDDSVTRVAVLLRCACGVEALQLELVVEDRLEEVERADDVRHHRLVRPVPGLADVRLGAEVEDVRLVRGVLQLADEVVDRRAVGEVGELDDHPLSQVADVVERAARRGADEGDDVRAELDERFREVRAHEAVGAGDEHRAPFVHVAELAPQVGDRGLGPDAPGACPAHGRKE